MRNFIDRHLWMCNLACAGLMVALATYNVTVGDNLWIPDLAVALFNYWAAVYSIRFNARADLIEEAEEALRTQEKQERSS